jgi:L-ascorbate metabolism protein UlaG (beta-lactamase superfamily)
MFLRFCNGCFKLSCVGILNVMSKLKLSWYGRCCFLLEVADKKILIDPYDTFHNVDIGQIDADYTLVSSVAHDHGHIGASPKSYTYGDEGVHTLENGIVITGIKSHESRGSNNLIFNIKTDGFSITNFADWGDPADIDKFTPIERKILASTDIAFARVNNILLEDGVQAAELALRVCNPKILIPHHFYPESFVNKNPTEDLNKNLTHYKPLLESLVSKLDYKVREINSYETEVGLESFKEETIILFNQIHPQIKVNSK